jgi:glutathione peroxidase
VIGFPCNQFGAQEPGDAAEIASFCSLTYDVSFPMMAKIEVNGAAAHPLYAYLKHTRKGLLGSEAIKWNFTKFLIDRKGEPVRRFAPLDKPEALSTAIESVL